jgi:membrane-associated protease RseP (regulator of RpoE activity)
MANMEHHIRFAKQLDRALIGCLFLLALAAPISIAATQTAWSLALLFWLIRLFVVRPNFKRDVLDLAILAFVGFSLLSSFFSYEPQVSLRKMMSVSLVTIVYLISTSIKERSTLQKLVAVLLISCAFTVAYTLGTRIIGKNLKVSRLAADSPLRPAGVEEGDTILIANGQNINSPDELAAAIAAHSTNGAAKLLVYRHELMLDYTLQTSNLRSGNNILEQLGIIEWTRGRDTRAAGFYGHYTTFAESLQLIASLCLGLLIAFNGGLFTRNRVLLAAALFAYCLALFLTVTRASWASFAVSASVMILLGASRKTILVCLALSVPLVIAGLMFLQQKRNVSFVDSKDNSTQWRLTVWREGFDLLKNNPRHLLFGIGMDSIKKHYREWHLFDDGKIPIGHMHSTPLQLALERGVPALLAWLIWLSLYLKMIWQALRRNNLDWFERGVLLGAFGGTIGFLTSGLVHYNWGDSEVVMIFYLIMGLSLTILRGYNKTNSHASSSK